MADGGLNIAEGGGLLGAGAVLGFLGKVAMAWIAKRPTRKDLLEVAAEAAERHMQGMREDFDALRDELRELKVSHAECENRCRDLQAGQDEATQQNRQLQQQVESLLRELARPGATAPGGVLHGALIELTADGATVTQPNRSRKTT